MSEDERPPLVNQQGAQTGEQHYGNVAGRDVTHYGIPAEVLDDIREVQLRLIDAWERQGREVRAELQEATRLLIGRVDRAKDEIRLHEIAERQRRVADDKEREERQQKLDADLAAIRREQRRMRRVLFWFGIGIIAALAVAGWLTYDRIMALALLRIWLGGAGTLAVQLWRGRQL